MNRPFLRDTLRLIYDVFAAPRRALATIAEQRIFVPALVVATAVAVGQTAALVPRFDYDTAITAKIEQQPKSADMTPHQKEEAVRAGRRVGIVGAYASAVFVPGLSALAAAFLLWLGLKVAGGAPEFVPTFAVTSFALLPLSFETLLTIPTILARPILSGSDIPCLLPSSLAFFETTPSHWTAALGSADLFGLWVVGLLVIGLSSPARMSLMRTAVAVSVLWIAYIGVFKIALVRLTGVST
jgi:hypothetical protein